MREGHSASDSTAPKDSAKAKTRSCKFIHRGDDMKNDIEKAHLTKENHPKTMFNSKQTHIFQNHCRLFSPTDTIESNHCDAPSVPAVLRQTERLDWQRESRKFVFPKCYRQHIQELVGAANSIQKRLPEDSGLKSIDREQSSVLERVE